MGFILVLGRQNVDWSFWNWYGANLVFDLFFSNDINRDHLFIFIFINFVSELFIIFSMTSSSCSTEPSNAKISPLGNLSILTHFFLALSMLLTAHTKSWIVCVCNNFNLFFPQNFPMLSCSDSVSFSKMLQIFPMIFSIK